MSSHSSSDQSMNFPTSSDQLLNPAAVIHNPELLQQIAYHQQQIMQHLRLTHHQYLMQHGISIPQEVSVTHAAQNITDINLWNSLPFANQELNQNGIYENSLNGLAMYINHNGINNAISTSSASKPVQEISTLFSSQGVCRWPNCERVCENYRSFLLHMQTDHTLNDRSTAQTRVQAQVINQLELQLQLEKERLGAMMEHLQMFQSNTGHEPAADNEPSSSDQSSRVTSTVQHPIPLHIPPAIQGSIGFAAPAIIDPGLPYMFERAGLDVEQEINRNRDFYHTADVRPPFTYASLIRQAIVESPDKQLTLNEIYNWFQNTFCYFRRNAATWKNAIRTNLSLHKCFVRYEDDFGSFWMVDDAEFVKRRHLSRGRPRKYDPIPSQSKSHQSGQQDRTNRKSKKKTTKPKKTTKTSRKTKTPTLPTSTNGSAGTSSSRSTTSPGSSSANESDTSIGNVSLSLSPLGPPDTTSGAENNSPSTAERKKGEANYVQKYLETGGFQKLFTAIPLTANANFSQDGFSYSAPMYMAPTDPSGYNTDSTGYDQPYYAPLTPMIEEEQEDDDEDMPEDLSIRRAD